MSRILLSVLGVVLVLLGAVWSLQGSNLLPGSAMSGSPMWLVIGLVAVVAGAVLLFRAARARITR
ncbi:MAG: hypothetical protein H7Y15_04905 [Pseudonocardia sp.]|nr:hypothetical protein [Pseudonocardia sp.]